MFWVGKKIREEHILSLPIIQKYLTAVPQARAVNDIYKKRFILVL